MCKLDIPRTAREATPFAMTPTAAPAPPAPPRAQPIHLETDRRLRHEGAVREPGEGHAVRLTRVRRAGLGGARGDGYLQYARRAAPPPRRQGRAAGTDPAWSLQGGAGRRAGDRGAVRRAGVRRDARAAGA